MSNTIYSLYLIIIIKNKIYIVSVDLEINISNSCYNKSSYRFSITSWMLLINIEINSTPYYLGLL